MKYFSNILRLKPATILILIFLLAVIFLSACNQQSERIWEDTEFGRTATLNIEEGKTGFSKLSAGETNITFQNEIQEAQFVENRHYVNGSGVTIADVDGDDLPDVYFSRLDGDNVLYKNLGGLKFEDITNKAGVAAPNRFSSGATFADVDGDGDADLITTAYGGPNAIFMNDGKGVFTENTVAAGLESDRGSTSIALADIDHDGDLDLYITNDKARSIRDIYPPAERTFDATTFTDENGKSHLKPEFEEFYELSITGNVTQRLEVAEADWFYLNDGNGIFTHIPFTDTRFRDESGEMFAKEPQAWGLSVRFHDLDDDGDQDIYICNDFESPDHIWINDGEGDFQLIDALAIRTTSSSSMGMDFSDIDRDGDTDMYILDMLSREGGLDKRANMAPEPPPIGSINNRPQKMQNTLLLNQGDGFWAEAAWQFDATASDWSWTTIFTDIDLDGYEDMLITNGHLYNAMDADAQIKLRDPNLDWQREVLVFPPLNLTNAVFRNDKGTGFTDMGKNWGFAVEPDVSHGMALGDLDLDGDLDVVVNRLRSTALVFENKTDADRIAVRLRGAEKNVNGIGAVIHVTGGAVDQMKEVTAGGYYVSGSEPLYVFAANGSDNYTITVDWPAGTKTIINNANRNQIYEIDEEKSAQAKESDTTVKDVASIFADVSTLLDHSHTEEPFNDFARQPLLPRRLSQAGPGLTWYDYNNDGNQDLIVGAGKGGKITVLENRDGQFRQKTIGSTGSLDQLTTVAFSASAGRPILLIGQSNFEADGPGDPVVKITQNGRVISEISGDKDGLGSLSMADVDGDHDLDLFIAGRQIPGAYPHASESKLYINNNGTFTRDDDFAFEKLVSGAVFVDIDLDADQDLVLATDWGPVSILTNDGTGKFTDETARFGLDGFTGWWNGVTAGDFNNDGRPDLIATNWGDNTPYRASRDYPYRVYHGDLDGNGSYDIIESTFHKQLRGWVPQRALPVMTKAMPQFQRGIRSYDDYAHKTVDKILGQGIGYATINEANTLMSMLFLSNAAGGFDPVILPTEAQRAPAFDVRVADVNGDGNEDVFLSQNFFATTTDMQRHDGGRGLLMLGDGAGKLDPVLASLSGLEIYGEQRGAAFADFDQDGRIDLAVSQNAGETKLYQNTTATPGIRIILRGPAGNIDGFGSAVQLVYADRVGPAHYIQAGSGYMSQDAATVVLGGLNDNPTGVRVVWPDGKVSEQDILADSLEIIIKYQ